MTFAYPSPKLLQVSNMRYFPRLFSGAHPVYTSGIEDGRNSARKAAMRYRTGRRERRPRLRPGKADVSDRAAGICGAFRVESTITSFRGTGRARRKPGWSARPATSARLNDPEFKGRMRSAFEAYQLALRRVLQAHQTRQSSLVEPQIAAS